jgi:hypothetical protein
MKKISPKVNVRSIATAVGFFLLAAAVMVFYNGYNTYQEKLSTLDGTNEVPSYDLPPVQQESSETPSSEADMNQLQDELKTQLSAAAAAGKAVCDIQTEYTALINEAYVQELNRDRVMELRADLKRYFPVGRFDELWYHAGKDAKGEWTYTVCLDDAQGIPVVWKYECDGQLYASAMGIWNDSEKCFDNMVVEITNVGASNYPVEINGGDRQDDANRKEQQSIEEFLGSVNKIVTRDKFGEEYTGTTDRYSEDETNP